jgi:hypothetical protein
MMPFPILMCLSMKAGKYFTIDNLVFTLTLKTLSSLGHFCQHWGNTKVVMSSFLTLD